MRPWRPTQRRSWPPCRRSRPRVLRPSPPALGVYILPTDDPGATLREVATWLEARRIVPLALRFGAPSLEEVFLRLTGEAAPADRVTQDAAR